MEHRIETKCVQGGYQPGNGEPRQIPIVQSTTFKYASSSEMGKLFDLAAYAQVYGLFVRAYDLSHASLTSAAPVSHTSSLAKRKCAGKVTDLKNSTGSICSVHSWPRS